ncbi:NAD(P)/FAD-dependent oxidoreductase [Lichenicoccus sp.]|uniref:NAD(P)/FAD-dependent oxidoreductase n=1 Tax=Lichenicoccus sp. TaxID=2781899 RepID=UPI003D11264E
MDAEAVLDCLVIGGGPAGLTASIYLARFRRNFHVIDSNASRAAWIPVSHNHAGFPEGIHGTDLRARMSAQARKYGAPIHAGTVTDLHRTPEGLFAARVDDREILARTVLLATGVIDEEPKLPGIYQAVQRGLTRHCGICDAYEVIDHRIAVLGHGSSGLGEALFLRTYTANITLFSLGRELDLSPDEQQRAAEAGIVLIEEPVTEVVVEDDQIRALRLRSCDCHEFDTLYSALGSTARSSLATNLGAAAGKDGCLIVDRHQRSSVDGLFVAGDVALGLDQISVAMGEAAVAATAIHNRLRARR